MTSVPLKDRVAALETEVAQLKAKLESAASKEPWWHQIWGSFADDPAFHEAMRLGRQYRESQSPRKTINRD